MIMRIWRGSAGPAKGDDYLTPNAVTVSKWLPVIQVVTTVAVAGHTKRFTYFLC